LHTIPTRAALWESLRDVLPVVFLTRLFLVGVTLLIPLWRHARGVTALTAHHVTAHRRLYPWLTVAFTARLLIYTGRFLSGGWVA
jgi:hypothetical protein